MAANKGVTVIVKMAALGFDLIMLPYLPLLYWVTAEHGLVGAGMAAVLGALLLTSTAHADLADAIARVKPSVVILGTHNATDSPRFTLRGTGFVVARGDAAQSNLVVTNAHVLASADEAPSAMVVQIRMGNAPWQMRKAEVLLQDSVHDLALLRFEGPAAPALRVRDSLSVQEGQAVGFTGFPLGSILGFSPVTHRGIVSAITPAALPQATAQQLGSATVRGLRSGSFDVFQIDGTAYPGNSGGPLFDAQSGEVLGVMNMVFVRSTRESALSQPSGISYAIPSRHVLQLLQAQVPQPPQPPSPSPSPSPAAP